MQVINPSYKYFPLVNGVWSTADGVWKLDICDGKMTIIRNSGIRLETYFSCANREESTQGFPILLNPFRDDEDFRFTLSTPSIHNIMTGEAYKFSNMWYGDKGIHIELIDGSGNPPEILDFVKTWADNPGWTCSCGHAGNQGKFCTECGKPRETWDCECGNRNNNGNFCTNCGRRKT